MSTGRLFLAVCVACVIVGCKGSTTSTSSTAGSTAAAEPSVTASNGTATSSGTPTPEAGSAVQSAAPTPMKSDGKTHSLVGEWVPANTPKGATAPTITFTKDQVITELSAPAPDKKGTMTQKNINAYHLKGDELTMKPISMVRGTDEAAFKQKVDQWNAAVAKSLLKQKPLTVKISWQDKDHFSFTIPAAPGPNGQPSQPQTVSFQRKQ